MKIPFRVTDAVISRGLTPPASLGWDHPWPAGTSVHRSGLPSKETTVFRGVTKQISGWKRSYTRTLLFSIHLHVTEDLRSFLTRSLPLGGLPNMGPHLSLVAPERWWAERVQVASLESK